MRKRQAAPPHTMPAGKPADAAPAHLYSTRRILPILAVSSRHVIYLFPLHGGHIRGELQAATTRVALTAQLGPFSGLPCLQAIAAPSGIFCKCKGRYRTRRRHRCRSGLQVAAGSGRHQNALPERTPLDERLALPWSKLAQVGQKISSGAILGHSDTLLHSRMQSAWSPQFDLTPRAGPPGGEGGAAEGGPLDP